MSEETTVLFRPVGPKELALIEESGWREFPPRLPEQPIFYPVLNEEYAIQIARDWNVRESGAGFVTSFHVDAAFVSRYPVQTVGGSVHKELWIPAEDLAEVNDEIQDSIHITDAFFYDSYIGFIPSQFGLARKTATEQLVNMVATFGYSGMDFYGEIS